LKIFGSRQQAIKVFKNSTFLACQLFIAGKWQQSIKVFKNLIFLD